MRFETRRQVGSAGTSGQIWPFLSGSHGAGLPVNREVGGQVSAESTPSKVLLINTPCERQSRGAFGTRTLHLASVSLCSTACLAANQQGPPIPNPPPVQGGQGGGCQWSRGITAQGTQRKMSSSVCVCVLSVEANHHATQAPQSVPYPLPLPLASPRAVEKRKVEGVLEVLEGGQPLTDKTEGPVTNPNPQSLTGQSLLSTAPIPNRGHIEDVKQQTSTCPLRYRPAQTGSHCTGRQPRPQPLTASPRQGGHQGGRVRGGGVGSGGVGGSAPSRRSSTHAWCR